MMKTNRAIFSSFLGGQAGEEVRRTFSANTLRNHIASSLVNVDPSKLDLSSASAMAALTIEVHKQLEPLRVGFMRLADIIKSDALNSHAIRVKAVLESAPFLIGSQYLIHSICGNWNNESNFAMTVLKIHATDVGVGQPTSSRIHRYQELLRHYAQGEAGEGLMGSGTDPRISDGAFNFAAPLMLLGYFPESLAGEILGVNLYLRQSGLIPPLEFIANDDKSVRQYLDLRRDPCGSGIDLLQLAETSVLEFLTDPNAADYHAVRQGYYWARRHTEALSRSMLLVLQRWLDPREAARHLISYRRPEACQYHEKIQLNGVLMQSLLKKDDTMLFLEHLAASPFVRAGEPNSSLLLTSLISSRGKMFRIFNHNDCAVFHRWIAGLPYSNPLPKTPAYSIWKDDGVLARLVKDSANTLPQVTDSLARQAYPRLLHTELTPIEETYAKEYVKHWLKQATISLSTGEHCLLPETWAPGILRQWLLCQHEASNQTFEEEHEQPSQEDVVDDILALAPLTMINGAWLAGCAHPAVASSIYGYKLFQTFYDELGNGIKLQNHPVIYRNLLKIVYGDLPATTDPGFANAPCFNDPHFELPVFWLSIGRFPLTYYPEILGLNLAMEISGVGGRYRRIHNALVAYGYPTLFFDLHNSIDNIATGHPAWAAESLDSYMSAISRCDRDEFWARARTGFFALNPPKRKTTMLHKFKDIPKFFQKARFWAT